MEVTRLPHTNCTNGADTCFSSTSTLRPPVDTRNRSRLAQGWPRSQIYFTVTFTNNVCPFSNHQNAGCAGAIPTELASLSALSSFGYGNNPPQSIWRRRKQLTGEKAWTPHMNNVSLTVVMGQTWRTPPCTRVLNNTSKSGT